MEFGNFANRQGKDILFAQVVNSLLLKIFKKKSVLSQISKIGTGKISRQTGKTQGICN